MKTSELSGKLSLDNQLDVSGFELNHLFELEMNSNLYNQLQP